MKRGTGSRSHARCSFYVQKLLLQTCRAGKLLFLSSEDENSCLQRMRLQIGHNVSFFCQWFVQITVKKEMKFDSHQLVGAESTVMLIDWYWGLKVVSFSFNC